MDSKRGRTNLVSGLLFIALVVTGTYFAVQNSREKRAWTASELALIGNSGHVMRVLSAAVPSDSAVLRTASAPLSQRALRSAAFRTLCDNMVATVTDPSQDGVGIAGPQVGILRRVVAVQRFDKEGEPFEVYPNVQIESLFGDETLSTEGCLSVPGYRGEVPRRTGAVVSWTDPQTLQTVRDSVRGFTAIIFQHECDHLDGILYTDKAVSLTPSER